MAIRDEFISLASHELRTPLTPLTLQMQGFARLIEKGTFDAVPTEKLKYMVEISDYQVGRLTRLIEQLLDISRISEGRWRHDPERVDLISVIRSVAQQLHHEMVVAECSLDFDMPQSLFGFWDGLRLEQLMTNLLTNAIKYASGKPVSIRVEPSSETETVTISVRDQGMGIALEDQKRIFERFERAVPSKNYGGLGLGLYISRQIVELHEGKLDVQSEKGHGATFTVELPIRSQNVTLKSSASGS